MRIRQRLRSVLWRVPVEQEVRDELAHHVELRTMELVDRGLDPVAARAEALRRLGDVRLIEQRLAALGCARDRSRARYDWWGELRQDVRFALRQCRRQPGFAAAAILTLGLGLGATTSIFSVVHAVILRPLPVAEPEHVLFLNYSFRGRPGSFSPGNFEYVRQQTKTLKAIAAVQVSSFNLTEGAEPERVPGLRTTWSYFSTLGVQPAAGRAFTAEDDAPDRPPVVVLSHRLWQRRFGGQASIVGKQIRLNGINYDVIGIMPASFDAISWGGAELLVPIAFTAQRLADHDGHSLDVFARRDAGTSLAQVNEELDRLGKQLALDFPNDNAQRSVQGGELSEFLVVNTRTRLLVLQAAVVLVLVIACVNIANLLLARLAARGRELAIRAAIGAGRGRIVRQVLTESLVLAVAGGAAGLLIAWMALPILVASAPQGIPRLETAALSRPVLIMAVALVFATALLVGLLPAWAATRRPHFRETLGDGKGATTGTLKPWVRQTLIAAQAMLVVIVLSGAALLVRSAVNLNQVPVGFDVSRVLSARVTLPSMQYTTGEHVRSTFLAMLDRLQSSAGVSLAALDSQPPLMGGGSGNGLLPEGRPERMESIVLGRTHFVSGDYFKALRLPLRAGRTFTPQDTRNAPLVMVVSETLARLAFPGEDPIGKRLGCCEGSPGNPSWKIIVGVVGDVHAQGPAVAPLPDFYLPVSQMREEFWGWTGNSLTFVARAEAGDPASLTPLVRAAVAAIDPSLPVFRITTMEEGLRLTMAQARFNTWLMALLGLVGLVLAALGIYSVIAWLVAQRTREIGVRMALGASASSVIREVTSHGLRPVIVGLIGGVGGALATGKLLEGQLFQVGARDPIALASVVALILVVAAAAAALPAWRASSIDPSRALNDA